MNAPFPKSDLPHPRERANILAKITISWIIPLFYTGCRRDLELEDVQSTLTEHKAQLLGDLLESKWDRIYEKAKAKRGKPSLLKALWRSFGHKFVFYGICLLLNEMIFKVGSLIFLGFVLDYFDHDSLISKDAVYLYILGLIGCIYCSVIVTHPLGLAAFHLGMKIRIACCSLIYRKALKLNVASMEETTIGQMINLLANDAVRFDQVGVHFHSIWVGPVEVSAVSYLLYREMGISCFSGIAFLLLIVPLQAWFGKMISGLRYEAALRTDERVRLISEVLFGLEVIKMYAWEKPFVDLAYKARKKEIRPFRKTTYINAVNRAIAMFFTSITLFVSLLTYLSLGYILAARQVFLVSAYFDILRICMTFFWPVGVIAVSEALVSVRRIETFLVHEEVEMETPDTFDDDVPHNIDNMDYKNAIIVDQVKARWFTQQGHKDTLKLKDMNVQRGSLVAVIGPNGSGKTSFLQLLMKELLPYSGNLQVRGSLSFFSQEAWIYPATLRQNVIFDQNFNLYKYAEVLRVCALRPDIQKLPHGDMTYVGEKGASLSGGQRARVNLARTVYRDADIYLLDDPLSAVDTAVGNELMEECIQGFLRTKTRVLVTHQTQFMKDVDYIYFLRHGEIVVHGTPKEIEESGFDIQYIQEEELEMELKTKGPSTSTALTQKLARPSVPKLISTSTRQSVVEVRRPSAASLTGPPPRPSQRRPSVMPQLAAEYVQLLEGEDSSDLPDILEDIKLGARGKSKLGLYCKFFKTGASCFVVWIVVLLHVISQVLLSGTVYWIALWTNDEEANYKSKKTFDRKTNVYIYIGLAVLLVIACLLRAFAFSALCMSACIKLHNKLVDIVVQATLNFLDNTPSGQILNRFSTDLGGIDAILIVVMMDAFQTMLQGIGVVIVIGLVSWVLLAPLGICIIAFLFLTAAFMDCTKSFKRLELITRGPVYTHLAATLQGLTTIRAFQGQERVAYEFDEIQNRNSRPFYVLLAVHRAFGLWVDSLCIIALTLITYSFLFYDQDLKAGSIALVITQCMFLTGTFQWGMRQSAEMELQMTSVERVIGYFSIDKEPQAPTLPELQLSPSWPQNGEIVFDCVRLSYSSGNAALKDVSFSIKPGEKIGIVGRSGAGKSSLMKALFRMIEVEGEIRIDGVDIKKVGLHDLRRRLSIIPQEPILFTGSLRRNLDPHNEFSDETLVTALKQVGLQDASQEILSMEVAEGGVNFSLGEKQLMCLGRAIVRNNKILVCDEATASIDPETDHFIQTTIRKIFKDCTMLTIAHRLYTVMDADRIIVMDAGKNVEFDSPHILLKDRDSYLSRLVYETEASMVAQLKSMAKMHYFKSHPAS